MNEKFARWDILLMQYMKRDWKKIIVWIIGIGLFSAGFVPAFKEIAKGEGLIGMFETLKNPAMISMVGPTPIESAKNYTLGAMYTHEMLLFCGLFAMIIAVLHVISHTRKEEDLGLTELVRSYQVGRQANSLATIMQVVFINIVLALFITSIMTSFGAETISFAGSFLFGLSVGGAGILGGGIGLVFAQIMPNSSSATGSSLGMIGLLYIIRAGTDVSNVDLSMFNPLSWTYLTYPFTENNWLLLLYLLVLTLFLVVLAFVLEGGRDMGAGYLPEREGRENAKQSLLSIRGLFIKINKGVIIAWLIAFVIMGAAYGSIYGDMQTFLESNEMMQQMFTHAGFSIEESFTGTIMTVMISLVTILPIALVNKLYSEENRLHLSQIYVTQVSRNHLYWTGVLLAIVISLIGILFASGSIGAIALVVMDGSSTLGLFDFIAAGYNYLPSVLFFISLASLALGWAPRLGKIVYVYLIYGFILNYFGGILDLPEWFLKTAIQSWIPQMPLENFDAPVFMIIMMISITLIVIGNIGYFRRDMHEGA